MMSKNFSHSCSFVRLCGLFFAGLACLIGTVAAAPAIPDSVAWQDGIEFASPAGEPLLLNLAAPKQGGPFPTVVCIHGGGFRAGKRESLDGLCVKLADRGYVAVTVSYRLAPKHPFPAAVQDVKAAVRWLRANAGRYRVDPARIGAIGYSAGGSLAQLLGVTPHEPRFDGDGAGKEQPCDVACVVNIFGANDFTKSYGHSKDAHEVLPLWFGGDLSTHRDRHIEGSPLFWVTPASAPTRCIHGTEDDHVALEQSQMLVDRLQAAAVQADLVVLEGAGHGFKGADAEKAERAILEFFDARLGPK
jgi:acetyl esterase/lipase